jgi:hypothetical protein
VALRDRAGALRVRVRVRVPVAARVGTPADGLTTREREGVTAALRLPVLLLDPVPVGELLALPLLVSLGSGESLAVTVAVPLAITVAVPLPLLVGGRVAAAVELPVRVPVTLAAGEGLPLAVAMAVPLTLARPVADGLRVLPGVRDAEPVAGAVGVPDAEPVAGAVDDALAVGGALAVALAGGATPYTATLSTRRGPAVL